MQRELSVRRFGAIARNPPPPASLAQLSERITRCRAKPPYGRAFLFALVAVAFAAPTHAQQKPGGDGTVFRDDRRPLPPRVAPNTPEPKASPAPETKAPSLVKEPAAAAAPAAVAPAANSGPAAAAPACTAPVIVTEPLAYGRMRLEIKSACRAGQRVTLDYGGAEQMFVLASNGRLETTLDCFAGVTPATLRLEDGTTVEMPVAAMDLDHVSKVAVLWRAPVDLDLHAFERAARAGETGHVWAGAPSAPAAAGPAADSNGHGFLSTTADGKAFAAMPDAGKSVNDRIEVYTWVHAPGESRGTVDLALDFASRGAEQGGTTCGKGSEAEVAFRVVARNAAGHIERQHGLFAAAECGAPIAPEARWDKTFLPRLRLGQ